MLGVSVIIPTYKRPTYLKKAIESVFAQTYKDWELIIVGRLDGAQDQTLEVIRHCQDKGVSIDFIEQHEMGISSARNMGIEKAKGDYVAFLDDDDCWTPNKLEIQVKYMEANPNIGLVYGCVQTYRPVNGQLKATTLHPRELPTTLEGIMGDVWITSSTVMIRKSCLEGMVWFDSRYTISEDWDLWLRFVQRWKIAGLPNILVTTVKDERTSLTSDVIESTRMSIQVLKNLELANEYKQYKSLRTKHLARLHYKHSREYLNDQNYWPAAKHFIKALGKGLNYGRR